MSNQEKAKPEESSKESDKESSKESDKESDKESSKESDKESSKESDKESSKEEVERKRKIFQDDQDYCSSKLSDICRILAFTILANSWAVLWSSDKAFFTRINITTIVISGAVIIAALVVDCLQYFFSYLLSARTVSKIKSGQPFEQKQYEKELLYQFRALFFYLKQVFLLIGAVLFFCSFWGEESSTKQTLKKPCSDINFIKIQNNE